MSFKNFILEGADVVQRNFAGKRIMEGWRHYRCIFGGRSCSTIALPFTAEVALKKYQAKFYPRGTWEDTSREHLPDQMPFPKAEIVAEIFGCKKLQDKFPEENFA